MKKLLFISNITKKITNFSYPSIVAADKLDIEFHLAANMKDFKASSASENLKLHHIDLERNPFHFKNLKAYHQLLKVIEEEKIDFIHCNTPIGGVLGRLAGRKKNLKKVIYTAHGFHFYEGAPMINHLIYKNVEKFMARYTDGLITMNNEDYLQAQNFRLKENGKVYYVPGVGIDTKKYENVEVNLTNQRSRLNIAQEDIVIISVGELIKRKNYESAIESVAKAKNNKIKFLICGEGPEKQSLQTLVASYGIEEQVLFLGFRDDVKELLQMSDIFLFISIQEGLPRAVMEAMATGLPCIASSIRGNTDLLDNAKGGYLNSPNDVDQISKSINILSDDSSLRRKMGKYNLRKISPFDTDNIIELLKNIYDVEFNQSLKEKI